MVFHWMQSSFVVIGTKIPPLIFGSGTLYNLLVHCGLSSAGTEQSNLDTRDCGVWAPASFLPYQDQPDTGPIHTQCNIVLYIHINNENDKACLHM